MKCPKCGYLGFDDADRCRHCGYEFSLSRADVLPELPLRSTTDTSAELEDYALKDGGPSRPVASESRWDLDRVSGAPGRQADSSSADPRASTASDLPLFSDDTPLITKASAPRTPLAVRRSTHEIPRARATPRATNLDWELESDRPVRRYVPAGRPHVPAASQYEEEPIDAGLPRRLMAVFIDGIILLGIDIAVVYFTMQICGVTMAEFDLVPKGPLVAFLVVQNIGYLIAFTAGGQTLGKMAAGIRVVAANPDEALDLGSATKRTAAWLVLAFPAGLGLLSALFSRDHRGLHDRFAGTRVVRAST